MRFVRVLSVVPAFVHTMVVFLLTSQSHTWSFYTIMPNNVIKDVVCVCVSLGPDCEAYVKWELQT